MPLAPISAQTTNGNEVASHGTTITAGTSSVSGSRFAAKKSLWYLSLARYVGGYVPTMSSLVERPALSRQLGPGVFSTSFGLAKTKVSSNQSVSTRGGSDGQIR
jgi:hypothetical protein